MRDTGTASCWKPTNGRGLPASDCATNRGAARVTPSSKQELSSKRQKEGAVGMKLRNPARVAYLAVRRRIMERGGLQPRGQFRMVAGQETSTIPTLPPAVSVPNLVGMFHPELRFLWNTYGIGKKCLLVSESDRVAVAMQQHHVETDFVTTDFFVDLIVGPGNTNGSCSVLWDLRDDAPEQLKAEGPFSSVIAQALLEHVIDPVGVVARLTSLLAPGGCLYGMTHTPSFHYHAYPRDYLRFHHDFFVDLPEYLRRCHQIDLALAELISRDGCVWFAYRKAG